MRIINKAQAGSFESSDIMILVEPAATSGRHIELESNVQLQYGDQIRALINKKLDEMGVKDIHLIARDKGALNPTICARIETAVIRASKKYL